MNPTTNARARLALQAYELASGLTDVMGQGLETPVLGLFGEIGSLLATIKKKRRDLGAYWKHDAARVEDVGDVLWYLSSISRRVNLGLPAVASAALGARSLPLDVSFHEVQAALPADDDVEVVASMMALGSSAGQLLDRYLAGISNTSDWMQPLSQVLRALLYAASKAEIDVEQAALLNLTKVRSRWPSQRKYPAAADAGMPRNEQLPTRFEIFVEEHRIGDNLYVLQKRNGVIIGDRLTDNKHREDDYRFHDVFHIAYAVHLGWSPVLRKLFGTKRRSDPQQDRNEDGARAILIEEGIATLVFNHALELKPQFFKDLNSVSYDLLKTIQDFVRGYEPERCELWQWQLAILEGFRVFRELVKHRRGYIVADLHEHTLTFSEGADRDDDYYDVRG